MAIKISPGSPLSFFVRTFLPNFSKSTVTDQIDILKNELATKTLPPYLSATDSTSGLLGKNPFNAKWNQLANASIMSERRMNLKNREFKTVPTNCIELIASVLGTLSSRLTYLDELVNKSFGDDIVNTALSYQQANLLRLVEMSEFFLIYARRFLIYVVSEEYKNLETRPSVGEPFVKGDVKWIENNLSAFTQLLRIYSQDKENFIRDLKNIPDVTISDDKEESDLAKKVHGEKLDPMHLGFIPYVFNPIYHIRMAYVDWRHSRLEAAKAERELLELRIQQYIMKRNGTDNAKMDNVINNAQERLKRLNMKITQMEESYRADYGA